MRTVLVALTCLWWRVDYWCKVLTPWRRLKGDLQSAQRSVLLDYVSPLLPVSQYYAIKYHDWAPAMTNFTYTILKIATIVSTGLLISQPMTLHNDDATLTVYSDLNASRLNSSKVGNRPFQRYYGIRTLKLSYPVGTSDSVVVPEFRPTIVPPDALSYTAELQGISSHMECEQIDATPGPGFSAPWFEPMFAWYFSINLTTPSCNISGVMAGQAPATMSDLVNGSALNQSQGFWGMYTCGTYVNDLVYPGDLKIDQNLTDHRLIFTSSILRWNSTQAYRKAWIESFATILCKPTCSIAKYRIDSSQLVTDVGKAIEFKKEQQNNQPTLDCSAPADMISAVKSATQGSPLGFGDTYHQPGAEYYGLSTGNYYAPDQLFLLMQAMKGDTDFRAFVSPETLIEYATKAFNGVFTQIAYEYMLQPSKKNVSGTVVYTESRLHAEPISFGILLGCLSLALVSTLILVRVAPRDVVSRDPQSLGAAATFLASSIDFQRCIRSLGTFTVSRLSDRLDNYSIRSHATKDRFQIAVLRNRRPVGASPVHTHQPAWNSSSPWWIPLSLQGWYAAIAILLPSITIAALQAVQVISDTHDGFIDIDEDSLRKVVYCYIPAIVLATEAALYPAIQFCFALLAPLGRMRHHGVPASQSLCSTLLSQTYFEGLYHSIRNHYFGSVLSIVAAFVWLFLTTISSGLFYVQNVPLVQPVNLVRLDTFNFTINPQLWPGDYSAGAVTGLIYNNNLSFPQ